ncbi:MAG: polysaccharide deacetylase [Magnetovibrio sp.]|nr:polysaccharide deacetylase [Magnetovibrio sp.]
MYYSRDTLGYGKTTPQAKWPNDAAIAVQFVVNYEEGGENCILHGDQASEAFLSEIFGAEPWSGQRHWNMESIYEYGARVGFWRLHDLFVEAAIPVTVFGVATALQRSPTQVRAMLKADWEIASHGLKWIDYKDHNREDELSDILEAIRIHSAVTGQRPRGWYTGRCSVNTVDLITEVGSFQYLADSYSDDLPYWYYHKDTAQLIVPYTLDANDMRFSTPQGFNSGDQFTTYLKDAFDVLYAEGKAGVPKMMSIGLHCRLIGRPGRLASLRRFIDYVKSHEDVWFARRIDIAEHWIKTHPFQRQPLIPSAMTKQEFIKCFGGVFEHSAWIAERSFDGELGPANDSIEGLHAALCFQFRISEVDERLSVLRAHPDLGSKLSVVRRLTPESAKEQAGAGLDALTDAECNAFSNYNAIYLEKFSFPFIVAVKGLDKNKILKLLQERVNNKYEIEFEIACRQVERIARLRLDDIYNSYK